jgi:hypothetical protein
LHHFIADGVWDAAPLESELLVQADRLVVGKDAVPVIDDTAMPKKGDRSVGVVPQYALSLGKTANCRVVASGGFSADHAATAAKIGSAAAETNSAVNPREENRTADRSGYLDQYTIDVSRATSIRTQNQIPIIGPSSAASKLASTIAVGA